MTGEHDDAIRIGRAALNRHHIDDLRRLEHARAAHGLRRRHHYRLRIQD
jgi:hypothetical protein